MSLGAALQQARRDRKLSLAEVTKATKIQPWVLEALESDRLHDQMSPVYVKGFLTTYARFLHVAPEPLLAQLPGPIPEPTQEALPPAPPAAPMKLPIHLSLDGLRRFGFGIAVSAALVGIVMLHPLRWIPRQGGSQVASADRAAKPASAAASKSAKSTEKPKQDVASAKAAAPAPRASKPEPAPAVNMASVTPVRDALPATAPATPALLATQPLELGVVARRTTWIRVTADGKLLTQQRLPRGAKERWTAKKQFELIISKPSEVEITLNGQPISPFAITHHGRLLITHRGIAALPSEQE